VILQSLCSYYDRITLSGDNSVATEGFSSEKAHFALVVSKSGKLQQVLDLRDSKGNKKVFRSVIVPQGTKKSVNIAANFLWGSTNYVLGADTKGKPERTAECHSEFKRLHQSLLANNKDEGAIAVLAFLSQWKLEDAPKLADWEELLKSNLVFQLDGDLGFIHDRSEMRKVWLYSLAGAEKSEKGICLISGEKAPIARVHPAIKGVRDSQSSGAALVSFNAKAYESYGKEQNFNAPVSETMASAYTKGLNHLLVSGSNRIQIADTTTVFWTERDSPVEGFFGIMLDPRDAVLSDNKELAVFLQSIREGKWLANLDPDIRFHILGLSPNAARLSVRFWHVSTVKEISGKLGQHFRDLSMVRSFDSDPEYPGMWRLLKETCNQKSQDKIPSPLLGGAVMQAILNGTMYPQALLSAVIGRIRAEQASKDKKTGKRIENVNYTRAAIIKAVLTRKHRILNNGMEVSVALDKENKNPAYQLGRLFAVLERIQEDAHRDESGRTKIKVTIRDKFYGSASATPQMVFPQLLKLKTYNIRSIENRGLVINHEKLVGEIIDSFDGASNFPKHFNLENQGLFAIGYYHQRQDFFKPKQQSITE
jgi:CRISPR-associated protein Csd1